MKGLIRPCRSHLGPELYARWQAHLCGLCLTLRDTGGHADRVLTGYDALLLSVLVEAQLGAVAMTTAAPCPLRGFARATVVASHSPAARLAATGAVFAGAFDAADKVADGDGSRALRRPLRMLARRWEAAADPLAADVGFDPQPLRTAAAAAAEVERAPHSQLTHLLAPTGEVVARLFEHTAVVAGRPANRRALADCGAAFGQLLHLIDAVRDRAADTAAGKFNPLERTGTTMREAQDLADTLMTRISDGLRRTELSDRALVDVLFNEELHRAVRRVLPMRSTCAHERDTTGAIPRQRGAVLTAAFSVLAALLPAIFVGGGWGGGRGGCCSSRGGPPYGYYENAGYGYPPRRFRRYPPPGYGYGYRRVGPSCGEILACNCCANLACNECCSGGNDW